MQGFSGTFAFNGTTLSLSPTTTQWGNKDEIGTGGDGHGIYPAITDYTMEWVLMPTSDFKQLQDFYLVSSTTGSVVADLPEYGNVDYIFKSYTGTILTRPQVGKYFAEHVSDVRLVLRNIRTL